MVRIALLFALPQEYAHFKRLLGRWRLKGRKPFKAFVCCLPGKELVLVQTGMGQDRMIEALKWLGGWIRPDLVIAAGFAGSLTQGLGVGDICWGETFATLDLASFSEVLPRISSMASKNLSKICDEHRIQRALFITTSQLAPKQRLSEQFPNIASIMDMESYAVGQFCYQRQVPFLSFRAISDGMFDEIEFDPAAISDSRGRVRIRLVMASVFKNPRLIRSYYLSWKRSSKAAKSLGEALAGLINLPVTDLRTLILENRLTLDERAGGL